MGYKTIMVRCELGKLNDGLLRVAADLGQLFNTHLIGIAACQPIQVLCDAGYATAEILAEDRKQIEGQMELLEAQFRHVAGNNGRTTEWRFMITPGSLADYIAGEARSADLIVTGPEISSSVFDRTRQVHIADLVFRAGRPVLILPNACPRIDINRVIIGWKEAPECRRAIADALPFLKMARHVTILEIASADALINAEARMGDVAKWLGRHGVKADVEVFCAQGGDAAHFARLVGERSADLVVAGAYGHSRLREWVLGGVTGDYLINPDRPVFITH